jgi:hypothetical protein
MQLQDLTESQQHAVVAGIMVIGTLYCFLGYRTLRFVIGLTGFLIAGSVAATLAHWVVDDNLIVIGVCGFIGGVSGAFALTFLYKTGIFLLGGLGGGVAGHAILHTRPETWIPFAVVGTGIAAGLLALLVERPVMMLATAAIGSWLIVSGILYFLEGSAELGQFGFTPTGGESFAIVFGAWVVLSLAGALAQFATRKRTKKT